MAPPKGRVKTVAVALAEELSGSEEEVEVSSKKAKSPKAAKSPVSNGEDAPVPAKRGRGRPLKGAKKANKTKVAYVPTGLPRGRPKTKVSDDEEEPKPSKRKVDDDSDEAEPKSKGRPKKEVPVDDEEDDEEEEEEEKAPPPAKRGRKAGPNEKSSSTANGKSKPKKENSKTKSATESKTKKNKSDSTAAEIPHANSEKVEKPTKKSSKENVKTKKNTKTSKPSKNQVNGKESDTKNLEEIPSEKIEQKLEPTRPVKQSKKKDTAKTEPPKRKLSTSEPVAENGSTESKPAKKAKMNKTATNYAAINFNLPNNKTFNFKISSWNVAGIRAWFTKGGLEFIEHEKPDIFCLQETKCAEDQLPPESKVKGYHPYWLCLPGGHGGVALYSKIMPHNIQYGIGDEEQDSSGRILTAEYEKFYLVCVYVPNSGRGLVTLDKRMRWDALFHEYLKKLDSKKPVIIAGDMNVSHLEIDLANPKTNKRNAGFTQEERDGMSNLLSLGFVDTFRHFYPDLTKAYTFWTYMGNARSKNVGWRLDYFIVSEKLVGKVVDNVMRTEIFGSDHCPITLFLNI